MTMRRAVRNLRRGEEIKHFEMLNLCFAAWGSKKKWERLYLQPHFDITKNVVVVEENGEWIGGGTAWFRETFLKTNGKTKAYIAGDGYVHPNHRGKGVYSTFMRSLNRLAKKRGASLGFGFISLYGIPFLALRKYGFIDIFHPMTKYLVLNPKNFLHFLIAQLGDFDLPKKLEGLKLGLTISFRVSNRKCTVNKILQIRNGILRESDENARNVEDIDLTIRTDIQTLLFIFRCFFLKKKAIFPVILIAILSRHLKLRFSLKFVKMLLKV